MFAAAVSAAGLPFFESGVLFKIPIGPGIPIQTFGVIVAAGVLIGAALLRRYAEWHGVEDDYIRGLTGWITVCGFIGAHVFDVIAYQWGDLEQDPILLFKLWAGISSYGGFIGGAMGFAFYVWWKRLPARLMADIAIVGLLPAFSIGRIGCSVVSDHIGSAVDPNAWYSFMAMDYPRFGDAVLHNSGIAHLAQVYPGTSEFIRAWNLGLIEFLYLVPVNILILWLAFRSSKRSPAGFVTVLTGVFYAPVRFYLDFLRPETSDPRYIGLTFAQWASILAFGASVYFAIRIFRNGEPAETMTKTSGEMQAKLKVLLKEDVADKDEKKEPPPKAVATEKKAEPKKADKAAEKVVEKKAEPEKPAEDDELAKAKREKEEKDEAEAAERRKKQDAEWEAKQEKKAAEAKAKAEAKKAADEKKAAEAKAADDDKKSDEA